MDHRVQNRNRNMFLFLSLEDNSVLFFFSSFRAFIVVHQSLFCLLSIPQLHSVFQECELFPSLFLEVVCVRQDLRPDAKTIKAVSSV